MWTLPLTAFDQFTVMAQYYYDWTAHPFYDGFWARMDVEAHYPNVKVPALISDDRARARRSRCRRPGAAFLSPRPCGSLLPP